MKITLPHKSALLLSVLGVTVLILSACGRAAASNGPTDTPMPSGQIQATLILPRPSSTNPTSTLGSEVASTAQQLLAKQLGIVSKQIKTVRVDPMDWPDSCLGIQLPGIMCAQQIVSGYKIVLEANGQTYEYHTGRNGLHPVVVPSLNISWQDGQTCNTAAIRYDQDVSYRRCGANPQTTPLPNPQLADQLLEFYQAYAAFSNQTPAGQIDFQGVGQRQASPAEQRMIAEWARKVVSEAITGRIDAALGLAISWHREGGLSVSCGDLDIYVTGEVNATSCDGSTSIDLGRALLYSDELEQLYTWLDTLKPFNLTQANPAADGETVRLIFDGNGSVDAASDQMQTIQDFSAQIYSQAEHWHATLKTLISPEQIVSEFLTALKKDPSGNSSLSYLAPTLSTNIQSDRALLDILGIQNPYRSFGISNVVVNETGEHARVDAGLNYVSPVKRSFILTLEGNSWQISTIIAYAIPAQAVPDNANGAEAAILDYIQALQDHQTQTAWSWLSAEAQQKVSQEELKRQSDAAEQISPTNIKLITNLHDKLTYAVTLWVKPSANNSPDWQIGKNQLWFSLADTDLGWRIEQVSSFPLK